MKRSYCRPGEWEKVASLTLQLEFKKWLKGLTQEEYTALRFMIERPDAEELIKASSDPMFRTMGIIALGVHRKMKS